MGSSTSVFTIPSGTDFLRQLAAEILTGRLPDSVDAAPDPLALSGYTILMPTRRACRALQGAFLAETGGVATLLPRIRPIAETDEDAQLLSGLGWSGGAAGGDAGGIPDAVSELERRLILTQMILAWNAAAPAVPADQSGQAPLPMTPAQAVRLARELGGLMDEVELEQADISQLAEDLPAEFATHWQMTLDFLGVATRTFPQYLEANGQVTGTERQNLLIEAETERLQRTRPEAPYLVAGVTGSVPVTASLMKAVTGLPQGAVVLPGLDFELDEAAWDSLPDHPEHPQHGLHRLLGRLEVSPREVTVLGGATKSGTARQTLLREALRPATATATWQRLKDDHPDDMVSRATDGLTYLEAASAQDEAEAVALILRDAAEKPGVTAALVTPDRTLARRVAARMESWGIRIDDSAGRPLMKTVPGTFLDLILECVEVDFSPLSLVALMKHPLFRAGSSAAAARRAALALELLAFRQIYLGRGLDAVRRSLEERLDKSGDSTDVQHRAVRNLSDEDRLAATALLERLEAAFAPLVRQSDDAHPLRDLLHAHVAVAEALAEDEDESSAELWTGEAGETAARFIASILEDTSPAPSLAVKAFPGFLRSLAAGEVVRPRHPVHPRLSIWGPFEARLQQTDIMILGGLNAGTWPGRAEPDPWVNRPMRTQIGLPAPEQAIGFAAHDFSQLAAAPRVYLTRAAKVDGVPTVPSRWLLRLEAVLSAFGHGQAIAPGADAPWLAWAQHRYTIGVHRPIAAPRPAPPLHMRPRKMSVTRIEAWLANPYSVFARAILKLAPLDPLETPPDMATRGRIIHQILQRFCDQHPDALPDDVAATLIREGDLILSRYAAHPRVAAFWRPRFARFATWFADTEAERRTDVARVLTEVGGERSFAAPEGKFILTARADRLDVAASGDVAIYDYKSGTAPSDKKVLSGLSPQLPLEAAIALDGGFKNIDAAAVSKLAYISATGGEPAGEERAIAADDLAGLAEEQFRELEGLVARYDDAAMPYEAMRRATFKDAYRYDDFAHLARVQEWSLGDGDGDE